MPEISLILPLDPACRFVPDRVAEIVRSLEDAGHLVEVLGVTDPRRPEPPPGWDGAWSLVPAPYPGASAGAAAGLEAARGDALVVLDPGRGYTAEDVARVVEPIVQGEAELALASRARGSWRGAVARRTLGSSDPLSGLVALGRTRARQTHIDAVGGLFALQLLVRARRRCLDVPSGPAATSSGFLGRVTYDDLRQFKRLSDARFGNVSRLVQFCCVGASGMVVDLSCYALFQWLLSGTALVARTTPVLGGSLALATAAAMAIAVALTWNFLLNRRLTFSDARGGPMVRQYLAYALSNVLGIALSFSLRLLLPSRVAFFNRHRLAAALVGIIAATGITFSMARWLVFRRRPAVHRAARTPHPGEAVAQGVSSGLAGPGPG